MIKILDIVLYKIGRLGYEVQWWLFHQFLIIPYWRLDILFWRLQQRENHRNGLYLSREDLLTKARMKKANILAKRKDQKLEN